MSTRTSRQARNGSEDGSFNECQAHQHPRREFCGDPTAPSAPDRPRLEPELRKRKRKKKKGKKKTAPPRSVAGGKCWQPATTVFALGVRRGRRGDILRLRWPVGLQTRRGKERKKNSCSGGNHLEFKDMRPFLCDRGLTRRSRRCQLLGAEFRLVGYVPGHIPKLCKVGTYVCTVQAGIKPHGPSSRYFYFCRTKT